MPQRLSKRVSRVGNNDGEVEPLLEPVKRTTYRAMAPIQELKGTGSSRLCRADTGASSDANGKDSLTKKGKSKVTTHENHMIFETAAGTVVVDSRVNLLFNAIGEIDSVLLDSTFAVFSVGRRCVDIGCGFHLGAFRTPVSTGPALSLTMLHV